MRKIILTVCVLLMSLYSSAQDMITSVRDTIIIEELKVVEETPLVIQVGNEEQSTSLSDSIALVDKYIDKSQYRNALKLLEILPPTQALLEKKANCHASLYEYPQAIGILETISEQNPTNTSLKLKLISIYEQTQWFDKTMKCYNELLELDPENDYYKLQRANFLYSREKIREALAQYQELCDSCDNNFLVRRLASCYEKLNELKTAKYLFAKAYDLDTLDGYSAASLVKLLIKDRQYELAIYASNRYMASDSTYTTMNALNAYAYYCSEDYNGAARRFQKCMENGDSSLLVVRTLGFAHFTMQRDSLAHLPLQLAYKQDTTNIQVIYSLAQTYFFLGDYPNSIKYYTELMKQKVPTEDELYYYYKKWGEAYQKNEDFKLAVGKYLLSLEHVEIYSDKVELLGMLARCLDYDLKDYSRAIDYYEQYRSGLSSREINLGAVEDDLSKLDLTDAQVTQINQVRKEIVELDARIVAIEELIGDKTIMVNGSRITFTKLPDSVKKQMESLKLQQDSLINKAIQNQTDSVKPTVAEFE